MGAEFMELTRQLDAKGQEVFRERDQQLNNRQGWINRIIVVIFYAGCLALGIIIFTIVPTSKSTCGIKKQQNCQTDTTNQASATATITCTLTIEQTSYQDYVSDYLKCFNNYVIYDQISGRTLILSLLIALCMGLPLVIYSLMTMNIFQSRKLLIQQHWSPEIFFKVPQLVFYMSFLFFLAAQGLYSAALYSLFKEQYVYMSIYSIVVGICSIIGLLLYKKFVTIYYEVAKQNLPKDSLPNNSKTKSVRIYQDNQALSTENHDGQINKQLDYDQY